VRSIAEKLHLAGLWWEIAQHGGYPIIRQALVFGVPPYRNLSPRFGPEIGP
jgi:hypothetical protein